MCFCFVYLYVLHGLNFAMSNIDFTFAACKYKTSILACRFHLIYHLFTMYSPTEKIVNVQIIDTTLKTVQNKSLVMPESKGKYDLEKIIELLKPKVPFVDPAIFAILIQTYHEKVIDLASQGYHIDTGLVHIHPVVTGTVPSDRTTLKGNKLKIVTIPGKALRNCVSKTKLRVSRKYYRNRYITEAYSANGYNELVMERDYIELTGRNLKIMGDFPECGVWFANTQTRQKYQVSRIPKSFNNPKSLLFQLPDELPAGNYEITVVTCYCGTKRLLTKPTTLPGSVRLDVLPSPKSNIAQQ